MFLLCSEHPIFDSKNGVTVYTAPIYVLGRYALAVPRITAFKILTAPEAKAEWSQAGHGRYSYSGKKGPDKYLDRDQLYLCVLPTATKSWRLRYRRNGRENTLVIDTYPTTSLKDARLAANGAHANRQRHRPKPIRHFLLNYCGDGKFSEL